MKADKKAYLVDVNLKLRIVIGSDIDPNTDEEFDKEVLRNIQKRIKEEGLEFISENIEDFNNDTECPFDPEFDE